MTSGDTRVELDGWIRTVLSHPVLRGMGHGQRQKDSNLGLGWLYYSMARILRPATIVVVGSYRGFVPLVLGKAQQDNGIGGRVMFIDPSLADNFWKDAARVKRYFKAFELDCVDHYCETTESFSKNAAFASLGEIGLLYIDGYHSFAQVKYDYELFESKLLPNAVTFLHDSAHTSVTEIYGSKKAYLSEVPRFVEELRARSDLQVFDCHLASGVAMVSRIPVAGTR